MKLYGTPPSHFTRKVRVVLHELGLPFQFVPVQYLMDTKPELFGNNPLLQIPVLEDNGRQLFESDLICEYLLDHYGKASGLTLFPDGDRVAHQQRLAVINGGMSCGVRIMRAKRSQIPDFDSYAFFQQDRASLGAALAWLDQDLGGKNAYGSAERLSVLEIALLAFVEWVPFREMAPNLDAYPNLKRFQAHWAERPSFARTRPHLEVT